MANTWKSHALDAMTLIFETLAEAGMLGGLASAIKTLDYYEGTSRRQRHLLSKYATRKVS